MSQAFTANHTEDGESYIFTVHCIQGTDYKVKVGNTTYILVPDESGYRFPGIVPPWLKKEEYAISERIKKEKMN